jgi:hypothetical protein
MITILANQSKKQLLAGVVGPAVSSGLCLGLALAAIDHHHTNSFVINMLLAAVMMYLCITGCKRVSKLLP